MSNVTSLSLLKGAKAAELGEELAKPDAAPAVEAPAEETVSVDVDTMSSDELDILVTEHGIEVPEEWPTLNVEAKRNWLKSQFEEAPAAEAVQSVEVAEVEEEKPAKKKASKSKALAAPALQGEVVPDDMLADLVFEIENMKEKQALELVGTLAEQTEVTFFKLGGVLSVIQANGWFAPYNSFREFVEKKHGIHYRKAVYWTDIYNKLAEAKVPWDKVKHIGWTKLKEIAGVVTGRECRRVGEDRQGEQHDLADRDGQGASEQRQAGSDRGPDQDERLARAPSRCMRTRRRPSTPRSPRPRSRAAPRSIPPHSSSSASTISAASRCRRS